MSNVETHFTLVTAFTKMRLLSTDYIHDMGLSRMEGLRERDGDGHTLSRQAPPVVSKGWVESGEFLNAPLRDNRGGGLSRKGVLSSLLYQLFL